MADFAILTGISVYPNEGFNSLDGPPHDLELMESWLRDPLGGAMQDGQIEFVRSPKPYPDPVDPDRAPPLLDEFREVFRAMMRQRLKMGPQRAAQDRLYLYFSGHGFCNRSQDRDAEAALYCGNASRDFYDHIFGTQYARVARGQALFSEIVLIMDCCRDSEVNRAPRPDAIRDTPDDGLAADVKLFAIYAVPKGGKAQERPIPEREGKVHGLLTHALIKALHEARPTNGDTVSSSELRRHLFESWPTVCGPEAAPRPDIYLPSNGDLYFRTRNSGVAFELRPRTPFQPGSKVILRDGQFREFARLDLSGGADQVPPGGPLLACERQGTTLKLRLIPGFYEYETNEAGRRGDFKVVSGGGHADI